MTPRSILFQVGVLALAIVVLVQAVSVSVVLLTPPPAAPRMSPARVSLALKDPAVARREGWRRTVERNAPFDTTPGTGIMLAAGVAASLETAADRVRVRMARIRSGAASGSSLAVRAGIAGHPVLLDGPRINAASVDAIVGAALMSPDFNAPAFEAAWQDDRNQWIVVGPADRPVGRWLARLTLMLGVSLLLIAPLTWWAARRLTRPVRALADAAARMQLDRPVDLVLESGPSEVRAVAAALGDMRARLERQLNERMRMLTAVAHDLRTPLTGLRVRAEQAPEAVRDRMAQDIARMDAMIGEILEYAAVHASVLADVGPVDLGPLAAESADDFPAGLVTVSEFPVVRVQADPARVRRVLHNLLHNAVRYGCDVVLEVDRDQTDAVVRVSDRGPGLSDDQLEAVFEPFYRLETSRNRDTGGVGLGLSIARALAAADGGSVRLSRRRGGGLIATLHYPEIPIASG